jgi:hypothetical protein
MNLTVSQGISRAPDAPWGVYEVKANGALRRIRGTPEGTREEAEAALEQYTPRPRPEAVAEERKRTYRENILRRIGWSGEILEEVRTWYADEMREVKDRWLAGLDGKTYRGLLCVAVGAIGATGYLYDLDAMDERTGSRPDRGQRMMFGDYGIETKALGYVCMRCLGAGVIGRIEGDNRMTRVVTESCPACNGTGTREEETP